MRIAWYDRDMRFREIEKRLLKEGFAKTGQRGSHCQYRKDGWPAKVTVPNHSGDIDPRTVRSIWKQAGIAERKAK